MKRQTILALAMLLTFGIGTATFAKTGGGTCCKGDSCPMKQKDVAGNHTTCCDDCDCCDKSQGATTSVATYFKGKPVYKTSKAKCTCDCCNGKDAKRS
jgi:hypothetical protein